MTPNDPEISRIVTEAERIRAKEARAMEKEERKDEPKKFAPLSIESLRAYRALYPHPPTYVWLFSFMLCLAFFLGSLIDEPLFPHDRLVFGAISGVIALYGAIKNWIVPIFWYARFHNWHKHLPFTLNGWEAFGSTTHILDSWYWRNLSIKIDTMTGNSEFNAALDAIVTILIRDINNVYYEEDVGEQPRRDWERNAKIRTITGSANSQVLGLLIDFFRGPMSYVIKKFGGSVTVAIIPDEAWYHAKAKPMGQTVG